MLLFQFIYLIVLDVTLIPVVLCELMPNCCFRDSDYCRLFLFPYAEVYKYLHCCFSTEKITVTGLRRQRLIRKDL